MAETLRELVVALSLDSSNFSRNMRTINAQIKEAESTFRLAGAGVENFEKTVAGTESKLSMLGNKLTQQNRAVEQYSRALVAANDKLKENYDRHKDYSTRLEQAKSRQESLRFEVETCKVAYEQYRDTLGETDSATIAAKQNLERYQEEYEEATAEVTKLEGQVKALQKTMQNSADTVSKAQTDLNNAKAGVKETEAEIKRLTEELYRICKKVLILMLVGVANIIDTHVVGSGAVLRGAVICFYLSNEGLSLLENAAYLGLPIPDKLREILAQLHERSKKEAEPTDKGEGDQDAGQE